jgi:hypothetical protein
MTKTKITNEFKRYFVACWRSSDGRYVIAGTDRRQLLASVQTQWNGSPELVEVDFELYELCVDQNPTFWWRFDDYRQRQLQGWQNNSELLAGLIVFGAWCLGTLILSTLAWDLWGAVGSWWTFFVWFCASPWLCHSIFERLRKGIF